MRLPLPPIVWSTASIKRLCIRFGAANRERTRPNKPEPIGPPWPWTSALRHKGDDRSFWFRVRL